MATLLDSYSEANKDSDLDSRNGTQEFVGQSFTGNGYHLDSCKF